MGPYRCLDGHVQEPFLNVYDMGAPTGRLTFYSYRLYINMPFKHDYYKQQIEQNKTIFDRY